MNVSQKVRLDPKLTEHHHLGTPAYVLQKDLQSIKKISKWLPRARIGIYLCKSPRHARSVSLILNLQTGMVSPQFYIKFDDTFETVMGTKLEEHGIWKEKCGFTRENSSKKNKAYKVNEQERVMKAIRHVHQPQDKDIVEDIDPQQHETAEPEQQIIENEEEMRIQG